MAFKAGSYDVIVVGAGHAGCEAALAAARMGLKTLLLTISLDAIAMMPCNPAIGGPAKGHLVREIDALGGQMAKVIDKTMIQIRMLNTGKGPAVHALRAQADKWLYQREMKRVLENTPNLVLLQDTVVDLRARSGRIRGVVTQAGAEYEARAVVITTGTYLRGRIIIGDFSRPGGPNGQLPSLELSKALKKLGLELMRFKTGTPPRIHRDTIDFSKTLVQPGDPGPLSFSFESEEPPKSQVPCWLTHTTEKTREIILANLHRSPLFSGDIKGVGPRYCPSIEDKVVRFAERPVHQVFLEPEGRDTAEYYVQGMSTSLPLDVQHEMIRSVTGLENARIVRPGYAIEYDCLDPLQLKATMETKQVDGLFTAGQINGTSGYEEAAAQGIVAGINAALQVKGEEPLILGRDQAYIGVLVDDLVTKGTNEPYRIMTSRAEYRLLLRQDNADQRLTPLGYRVGLVGEERYRRLREKQEKIQEHVEKLSRVTIKPHDTVNSYLESRGSRPLSGAVSALQLLRRPEISYADLQAVCDVEPIDSPEIVSQVETQVKYAGYIEKQQQQVALFRREEQKKIPADIDYGQVEGLSREAVEKLSKVRPVSVGQAGRISGVSPADIAVLLIYLEQRRRKEK